MLDGLDMTGLYSHKFHIYHILSYQIQPNLLNPRGFSHLKNSLWIFCVFCFWWLKPTSLDWNMPGWENRYYMYIYAYAYVYIYTWNYIYLRVYIYYKIYLIFTIYTLYSIHPYWKQSRKLEAPDRTWWSLKVEEKILGDQGANLWGNCRGNHDFMFVVFVWFWGGKSQGWSIFAPIGCPCFSFVFVFFVLQ